MRKGRDALRISGSLSVFMICCKVLSHMIRQQPGHWYPSRRRVFLVLFCKLFLYRYGNLTYILPVPDCPLFCGPGFSFFGSSHTYTSSMISYYAPDYYSTRNILQKQDAHLFIPPNSYGIHKLVLVFWFRRAYYSEPSFFISNHNRQRAGKEIIWKNTE